MMLRLKKEKIMRTQFVWTAAMVLMSALTACSSQSRAVTLVHEGKPTATIIIRKDAPQPIVKAAEDLQQAVQAVSGATLPIATDDQAIQGAKLFLGSTTGVNFQLHADLGFDGCAVNTIGDEAIAFLGPNDKGAINGVYWFIDWKLGVHRLGLRDDALVVPQKKTIVIEPFSYVHKPSFAWRQSWINDIAMIFSEEEQKNLAAYHVLNRVGGVELSGAHSLEYLVPPDKYFAEHPEYFPLIEGKRQAHGQLCLSNPDVLRIVVEQLKTRDPNVEQYAAVSPNDHAGWCECDECKKMAENPAARMMLFCNRVVEALEPTHPKLGACFLAYNVSQTMEPPLGLKAHPRVVPLIAPLAGVAVHPLTDPDCPNSVELRRIYEGWHQVAEKVATYPYMYGKPFENILPQPVPAVVAEDVRYYHDQGVMGVQREHVGHYNARGIGWELSFWLEWQLLWDIDQDVNALRRTFFEGYYGQAALPMRRIYQRLEAAAMNSPEGTERNRRGFFDCSAHLLESVRPTMEANLADIAEAKRLADTPAAQAHVAIDADLLTKLAEIVAAKAP